MSGANKNGNFYTFKDGGIQNFLEIMAASKWNLATSLVGYHYGSKKGKTPKAKILNSILYGVGFGLVGSGADYVDTALQMDAKFDGEALIHKAVSEGVLQAAFDFGALGISKLAGKSGLKDTLKNAGAKVSNVVEKMPLGDFIFGNIRRAIDGQNIESAELLINRNITKEQRADIEAALKEFGGEIQAGNSQHGQAVADALAQKYGKDSTIAKTAQDFVDIWNTKGYKERQAKLLQWTISDESGKNLSYLLEVTRQSPEAQRALENIIKYSGIQLKNAVSKLGLSENQTKMIFDEFAKGTAGSYENAMNLIAQDLFDEKIYRVSIDRTPFDEFLATLKSDKLHLAEPDKAFVRDIIEPLFSGDLSFKQLNNIRQNLNGYFKNIQNPTLKDFVKGQIGKNLKNAIDDGINQIFKQNTPAYAKAQELFQTALKDYANMKGTLKVIDDLKANNAKSWENNAVKALIDFAKGQGEENLTNLARLTRHLTPENRAVIEMNILNGIFEKSRFVDEMINVDIFDSTAFLKRLEKLTGKNGEKAVFESQQAKEMIAMVNDFHTLFKKDADIARRLSPARSNDPTKTPNMATTASGKVAMMRIKLLFEFFMRNMPEVFWLPKAWNEGVKGAALRFHLHHALSRSNSVAEFKQNFSAAVKRSPHTTEAQKIIKEMNKAFDEMENLSKDLSKMSDDELFLREKFGENYAEFKGKGQEAVNHLLKTKSGQVQGAWQRQINGQEHDIGLVWGEAGTGKSDGYGLAKIVKYHPEAVNEIDNVIKNGTFFIDEKGRPNFKLDNKIVGLRDNWQGEKTPYWIISSYKKGDELSKGIDSAESINTSKENYSFATHQNNSNTNQAQSQAPQNTQKSILDLARENTERLRAEQIEKELAQKETELAELKRAQEKQAEIIAQKESRAGISANEAQKLEIGQSISVTPLQATKIVVNDSTEPFNAHFVIAKKSDIKPNFERTGTQGRSEKQSKVIESIQSDFKPHLIFEQSGGFEGLPLITKDGQVIAGNHRAEAINALSGENLARYKQAAKDKFGVDLKDDEVIVRLVDDADERELVNLAFMSNVGRESNLGEKALSNLAKFEKEMPNLPNYIQAESVDELQNIIAKTLDKQGAGLNTFDTNLALFSKLAKNSQNNDILDALNKIQNLSAEEKSKILKMFVDNAGSFYNLAKDAELKNLDLRPYLNDSLVTAANSYATRAEDYARLLDDISHILSLDENGLKETLKLDKNLFENLKSKALGLSFARFARLENPSSQLFDFLKFAKSNLEDLNSANLFDSVGKRLDELDIYDFLKHSINQGRENADAAKIISMLDDLRTAEQRALGKNKSDTANKLYQNHELQRFADYDENGIEFGWKNLVRSANGRAKPELDKIYSLNNASDKEFLSDFFRANNDKQFTREGFKTSEQSFAHRQIQEIFDRALGVASRLGVTIKFESKVGGRSFFDINENAITINATRYAAEDLAHELIHATFHKGYKIYKESPSEAKRLLTARQIRAYKEIEELYKTSKGIWQSEHPHHEIVSLNQKMPYAYESVDEFIAELSSPEFRTILKKQSLWERIGEAILRFFTIKDPNAKFKKTNAYEALKERYFEILDDFGGKVTDNSLLTKQDAQKMLKEAPQLLDAHEAQRLEIVRDLAELEYKQSKAPQSDKAAWQRIIDDKKALFEELGQKMSSIHANIEAINEHFFGIKAEPTLFAPKRDDGLSLFDDDRLFKNDELFGKGTKTASDEPLQIATPKEPKSAFHMRQEVRETLKPYAENHTPIINKNDGRTALITAKNINKLSSDRAAKESIDNGFNEQKHFAVANHLPKLYENAKFRDTMPDKNGYDNLQIHHYTADFVLDGEPAQAKITLKEVIDGQNAGNRIYTLELESVAKLPTEPQTLTKQNAVSRKPISPAIDTPTANPKDILPQNAKASQGTTNTPRQTTFKDFYENLSPELKSKADKSDFQTIYDFLNDFDFSKRIIKGTPNAKLATKINKLLDKNPSFSFSSGKSNELYNLDNYIDFVKNPAVKRAYIFEFLGDTLKSAGFFIPKDSVKLEQIVKKILKFDDSFSVLKGNDEHFLRRLKAQSYLNDIWTDKDNFNSYLFEYVDKSRLQEVRNAVETATNTQPLKEFGTNYAEFYKDGAGAIKKLIAEADAAQKAGQDFNGQVAGAFEKEIDGVLSDIDLVWGNEKFGLAHILAKHPDLDLNLIPQIVEKGKVEKTHNGYNIIYNDFKIGLNVGWNENGVKVGDNKWIVTAFDKTKSLSEKQGSNSASFTKGEALPQNSNNDIIPKIANKFNTEKEHLENLVEAGNDLARLADFAENGNLTAKRILENYKSEPIGRGYIGYSMSVNALDAQANGVKPLSKFNARDAKEVSEILDEKITLKELRELLQEFGDTGEYHHTSKFYNETKHYSIAEMFLNLDSMKKYLAKKNTNKDIIAMNTKAHNKTANLINKAIEFVKNANDIDDKAFILKELKDNLKNSKWHLNFSNKFGSIYDYSEPTAFQYNTLRNNPKFQAYMNEFNPKFDTMADKNLDMDNN